MNRLSSSTLSNLLEIESDLATKTLIVAAVSGVIAALIDRIIDLPTMSFLFAFSEFMVALNGPTYALFKGKDTLGGAVMGAVNGVVTLFLWWITAKMIGTAKLVNPADAYNVVRLFWKGALVGLVGFGWFALMHHLPDIPLPKAPPKRR